MHRNSHPSRSSAAVSRDRLGANRGTWARTVLASTLLLALYGYNIAAPFLNKIAPDGSTASIALRGLVLALCVLATFRLRAQLGGGVLRLLFPMIAFIIVYSLRWIDNAVFLEYELYAPLSLVLLFMFGASLFPALAMALTVDRISADAMLRGGLLLALFFLIGLALNAAEISSMSKERVADTMLIKLNAISLASVCSMFALFSIIIGKTGLTITLARVVLALAMIGVMLVTQSRGPLVAFGLTLVAYFAASPGRYKAYVLRSAFLVTAGLPLLAIYFEIDLIYLASSRFMETGTQSLDSELRDGTGRLGHWSSAWRLFLESPLVGDRVMDDYLFIYPHNIILESMMATGLVGTGLLAIHLFMSVRAMMQILGNPNSTLIDRFVSVVFLKSLVEAQLSGAIWGVSAFWVSSACVIALRYAKRSHARASWHKPPNIMHLQAGTRS